MNLINVSTSIYKGEMYVFSSNIHIGGTARSFKLIKYKISRGGLRGGGGGGREHSPSPCLIFFCYKNTKTG